MKKIKDLLEKLDDWALDYIPTPIYRIPRQLKTIKHNIKFLCQKVFRKNHITDREVWDMGYTLINYIQPRLKAFIDSERQGFPAVFSEYDEHSGFESKEQYDDYIKSGDLVGGGAEAWEKTLQEMLFAFEYVVHEENPKKIKNFYKLWDLEDPHEKKESNKKEGLLGLNDPFYYNVELALKYSERASKGFELFGKYIQGLWD